MSASANTHPKTGHQIGDISRRTFLLRFRIGMGYSQEAMASILGVSQITISRMERGKVEISDERWDLICDALGIPPQVSSWQEIKDMDQVPVEEIIAPYLAAQERYIQELEGKIEELESLMKSRGILE